MEVKKKTFLENLRIKTKLPNLKKPAKKTPKKQGKKLAYRRSLSVPDLRLALGDQTDLSPMDSAQLTGRSDAMFFGSSPGQSDTDSIASGSIASGYIFTDQLSDTVENRAESPYRTSAPVEPVETLHEVEEGVDGSEIYSQIDTSSKVRFKDDFPATPAVTGLPVPAPRRTGMITPTRTMSVDREDISPECLLTRSRRGGVGSIVRSNSFEDEKSPYTEKLAPVVQRKKLSSNQRAIRRYDSCSMPADEPVETSAEGASLDQACGTPSEERVSLHWSDSDPDREVLSPFFSEVLSMEECQLDEATEEALEISEQGDTFDDAILDPADGSFPMPLPLQRYRLNIDLKEGKNLVVRDKRSGTSDPYVKFKLEGKQFYKSKVVYKNLNPRWNESFSHPLRDREHVVEVLVYDKNLTIDEFMGSTTITLKDLELYKTIQMELPLADPKSKENDMGVIIVDVCIMFRDATIKRSPRWPVKKNKPQGGPQQQQNQVQTQGQRSATEKNQRGSSNHVWTRVFSITLVEGQDLPHHGGDADIHVRFQLGDQKYRSKNLCIQANPQWREQFDFNHYEDNQEPLQVEVFSKRGRKCEESWGTFESDLSNRPFNERQVFTHVLDQGGRLVFLVTQKPCSGVSISVMNAAPLEQPDVKDTMVEKYSLKNSHRGMAEVGFLQVKVIKATDLTAADLNGKSDPFCVLELGNSRLQTQMIPKTLNPEWNKVFTFPIKDIHDVVELLVFDDNIDKAPSLLGKVSIPLLTVQNGQQICRQLKREGLVRASKGTITLVLDVIYNKVRAGVKSFGPKEEKYTEEIPKFAKKVLAQNILRVRKITTAVLYTLQYIKSLFQWESTQRSLIAFLVFLLTVWYSEPFMLPLFLLLLIGWSYFKLGSGKASAANNLDLENNMGLADDEEEDEKVFLLTVWYSEPFMLPLFLLLLIGWNYFKLGSGKASAANNLDRIYTVLALNEPGKTGLMDKIHMVQEVILAIQNMLDEIASVGERIKNLFNWSVPFMSCLTCLLLFLATVVLYYIPVRYMVLLWGADKFTAKLRNPYTIDNNGMLDFLKRVPCDVQKVQYGELRAPGVQGPPRRRK